MKKWLMIGLVLVMAGVTYAQIPQQEISRLITSLVDWREQAVSPGVSFPSTCRTYWDTSGNFRYSCNGAPFATLGAGTVTGSGAATEIAVWTTASNILGYTDFTWDETNGNLFAQNFPGLVTPTVNYVATLGGTSTTIDGSINSVGYSVAAGGVGHTLQGSASSSTNYSAIIGGTNNTLSGAQYSVIVGGCTQSIIDGNYDVVAGGCNNVIGGGGGFGNDYNVIAGGSSNTIGVGVSGGSTYNFIAAANGSVVGEGVSESFILGGNSNSLGDNTVDVGIIGSGTIAAGVNQAYTLGTYGLSITHNNVVLIGAAASSQIDNSVSLGMSAVPEVTITANLVELGQIGSSSVVLQFDGSTSGSTSLKAGAAPTPTTFTLPTADGTADSFLKTNGSGALGFIAPGKSQAYVVCTGVACATSCTLTFTKGLLTSNSGTCP